MARESYVWRNGEFVPKRYAGPRPGVHGSSDKRADFSAPYVVRDIPAYRSMKTGEMIDGRRAHREHLKQHDLVELGNEMPKLETTRERLDRLRGGKDELKKDIAEAIAKAEQGYVQPPEERVDAADFGLKSLPETGDVLRSTAPIPDAPMPAEAA